MHRDENCKKIKVFVHQHLKEFYLANKKWCDRKEFFAITPGDQFFKIDEWKYQARFHLKKLLVDKDIDIKHTLYNFEKAIDYFENDDDVDSVVDAVSDVIHAKKSTAAVGATRIEGDNDDVDSLDDVDYQNDLRNTIHASLENLHDNLVKKGQIKPKPSQNQLEKVNLAIAKFTSNERNLNDGNSSSKKKKVAEKIFISNLERAFYDPKDQDNARYDLGFYSDLNLEGIERASSEEREQNLRQQSPLHEPRGFAEMRQNYPNLTHTEFFATRESRVENNRPKSYDAMDKQIQ